MSLQRAAGGASSAAIESHYDVGNDFYRLWLDANCTYSSAFWGPQEESLEVAQQRKLDYIATEAGVRPGQRVLDIGCGWGSMLHRLCSYFHVAEAVGLTLSKEQADYAASVLPVQASVRIEHWADHVAPHAYDAIVSVGAFEHFARPEDSSEQKVAGYRAFFEHCRGWLRHGGGMCLQTIAYDNVNTSVRSEFLAKEVFPESELPHLHEIVSAVSGVMRIVRLRNDAEHYTKTLNAWLANFREHRAQAVALVGEGIVKRYERYLQLARIGFMTHRIALVRISLLAPAASRHTTATRSA